MSKNKLHIKIEFEHIEGNDEFFAIECNMEDPEQPIPEVICNKLRNKGFSGDEILYKFNDLNKRDVSSKVNELKRILSEKFESG